MPRKKYTTEEIIRKLREAEVLISQGQSIPSVCKALGVADQTFSAGAKPTAD